MSDISKVDKNFVIETQNERDGMKFYDAKSAPIRLFGVWHDGECYRRVPKDVAEATSDGVSVLSTHTSGGRVRFITDSPYVILKAEIPPAVNMSHMARSGSSGFDLYVREAGRECYKKSYIPEHAVESFSGVIDFDTKEERLITVNFPLYNGVKELYIGLHENASLLPAPDYSVPFPMVSYGSSITQGGCTSRPGNAYQSVISRRYDSDFVNLGFSGSAKGEDAMRDYLASFKMSAFIFDYDFNAPTNEHLIATHKPIYEAVRKTNPDIPIIIMARPYFFDTHKGVAKRNEIVKATYDYAKAQGDEKVHFISSHELFELCEDNGTVDGCHPNDFGFFCMAKAVMKELDKYFPPIKD